MAVLKAIVSLYRAGEEKPIERYKTRVEVAEENKLFSSFQKIEFLGLNEPAQKFGLGSFDLKFYRLTKINGKAENYAITTQQQLELELPFLLGSDGESELNGKKWTRYMCLYNNPCSILGGVLTGLSHRSGSFSISFVLSRSDSNRKYFWQ